MALTRSPASVPLSSSPDATLRAAARATTAANRNVSATAESLSDASSNADQPSAAAIHASLLRLTNLTLSQVNFRASATAFCTELALLTGAARVTLGWLSKHDCKPVAVSHTGSNELEAEQSELLGNAMLEAIDQRSALHYPAHRSGDAVRHIVRAQERLVRSTQGAVLTVPMACQQRAIAAVVLEFSAIDNLINDARKLAEKAVTTIAPILLLLRERDAPWYQRHGLRRPRTGDSRAHRRMWRFVAAVSTVAILAAAFVPIHHTVSAQARIEGEVQRIVAAPTKGYLKEVLVRPGDVVKAGQLLAAMGERDLELERNKLRSEIAQHEGATAAGFAKGDRSAMAISQAKVDESRAQLGLIEHQLEQIQLTAPIDGILIQGDLAQSIGAPVDRGQTLFTVAPMNRYRVIVELDERDIRQARIGQTGELSLSALPWDTITLTVKRIAPMANVIDGRNVFELETLITGAAGDIRPGLRGTAHLAIGRASLLKIWGHRAIDNLKRWTWRWAP